MNGKRALAWRNLMVAAINTALERGLLGLDPGVDVKPCVYSFKLDGMPGLAGISDSGYGEVAIRVAVLPTERGAELVRCFGSGLRAGDCYASGWLTRRPSEAWLQTPSRRMLSCRPWLLRLVACAEVEPLVTRITVGCCSRRG